MAILTLFASGLILVQSWCGGEYHADFGTNFGSCEVVDRSAEIQAPGDAGDSSGK